MIGYRARLERDLARWQERGWVTREAASAISADAAASAIGSRLGLAGILSLLGAVLIAFGAMTFVASNWQAMSKLARLGILFAGLWASHGAAAWLLARDLRAFGHAALLAGIGIFGASIMLIAQMYHMDGNPPDAVLTWGAGAMLSGILLRSTPAMVAATLLLGLWSGWESVLREGVHWAFLPAWAVLLGACSYVTRWRPLYLLLALALGVWIVALGYLLPRYHNHHVVVIIGALLAGAAALAGHRLPQWRPLATPVLTAGATIAFAGLWAMQFTDWKRTGLPLVVIAPVALALLIGAIAYAMRTENRPLLWTAYTGFSIELVSVYFKTIGTLIGTSLFFLSAGLMVIGLAWIAWQLHKRATPALEAKS
jgi:uncharacterized membrane protein